uniref:Uncharacterized protein n=1 Tax=Heterorhabditis bacteriophora TaxID=37862 RepID=A0A1I7X2S7_HETBA
MSASQNAAAAGKCILFIYL